MDCEQIQTQINQLTNRIQLLEQENGLIKKGSLARLFYQNFLQIDSKYQKLFRKYMKCLYKYGVYQSTLNNVISKFNNLVDDWSAVEPSKEIEKINLQTCLANFGLVYENNKAIGEVQMEKIISQRVKKEATENRRLFLQGIDLRIEDLQPKEVKKPTANQVSESNLSLQTASIETFPSYPSEPKQETVKELQKDQDQIQVDLQITESSDHPQGKCEQTVSSEIETQRYLKKLLQKNTNSNYQQFLNDEVINRENRILTERVNSRNMIKPPSCQNGEQFTESLNFFTFDQGIDKENLNFTRKQHGRSGFRQVLGNKQSGCDLQTIENSQKKQSSFLQMNTSISSIRNKESQSPTNITTQQECSFLRQSRNCPKAPVVKSNGGKLTSLSDLLRLEEIELSKKNGRRSRTERLKQ